VPLPRLVVRVGKREACRRHRDPGRVASPLQLTDQAPDRDIDRHTPVSARLLPRKLESALGVIVGQRREGRIGDLAGNSTLGQHLGDGPSPFSTPRDRGVNELLGEVRVAEPSLADELGDVFLSNQESGGDAQLMRYAPLSEGLPSPQRATNAVGIPATPRSTVKPRCSRKSASAADERLSVRLVSAKRQIRLLRL